MKKLHSTLLVGVLALIAWTITGCTGYPDGPGVSLISAESKLTTTWRVQDASFNGQEITANYADDFFKFDNTGDFQYFDASRLIKLPPFTQDTVMSLEGIGTWEFVDGKKQIEILYSFEFEDPYNSDIIYNEDINNRWDIARLTEEELWIRNGDLFLKLQLY